MSNPRLKNTRDIGALIRRRRKDLGIDQAALADKIGVSRAWVIKVERGHPNAQIGLVLRLLNYLDVPLSASLDDTPADNRGKDILDEVWAKTIKPMQVGKLKGQVGNLKGMPSRKRK